MMTIEKAGCLLATSKLWYAVDSNEQFYYSVLNKTNFLSFSVALMDLARELANTNSGIYRLWIPPFGAVNIYNANDVEVRSVLTFI